MPGHALDDAQPCHRRELTSRSSCVVVWYIASAIHDQRMLRLVRACTFVVRRPTVGIVMSMTMAPPPAPALRARRVPELGLQELGIITTL